MSARAPAYRPGWALALQLALRDLRSGLHGFGIFLACIALGVAAISGVGAVSRSLADTLAREGRTILGGDVSFSLIQREASAQERAFLDAQGKVSPIALLRAMSRRADGESALVEIKAVDDTWPAAGAALLAPPLTIGDALASRGGTYGVVADEALAARLDLKIGDTFFIGEQPLQLRALLVSEPDKLAGGIGFGPRVLMSQAALRASGLIQPGSLVRWTYRIALATSAGGPAGLVASDADVTRSVDAAARLLPQAGWEVRTRNNTSPQFSKNLDRFAQFLTLLGLTVLVIGGVGVANAVRGHIERKRTTIATLKAVGASASDVFRIVLTQIMAVAIIGTLLGAAIGAALPFVVSSLFGALIPFPFTPGIYLTEIGAALLYGLLTALVFALPALGRAHDISVAGLFRDQIEQDRTWPRARYLVMLAFAAAAFIAAIVGFSADRRLTLIYAGATLAGFLLLRGMALAVMAGARALPRASQTQLRLAIANIHRPGALTPSIVLSLGLGLALLVTLALIDGNIRRELNQTLPGQTPSFFFIDVPHARAEEFDAFLKERAGDAKLDRVAMMRGRLVSLNGVPSEQVRASENATWILEGDRGITYADDVPDGSVLKEGAWWPKDYAGPPLVSFEADLAAGVGLKIGDTIAVNVLGRTITAKIANLRTVNWRTLGINFVMVFSPNTFAGAPHTDLATLAFPKGGDTAREATILRDVARAFPAVTSVRVRDALEAVNDVVSKLALAIRGASSIALIASVLVLAGALAAGQRSRIYDAVVLKTLGATRRVLLSALLIEFGLLGLATAIFGLLAGSLAAFFIVTYTMKMSFIWLWAPALGATALAVGIAVVLGLAGTCRVLGQKPAMWLRGA